MWRIQIVWFGIVCFNYKFRKGTIRTSNIFTAWLYFFSMILICLLYCKITLCVILELMLITSMYSNNSFQLYSKGKLCGLLFCNCVIEFYNLIGNHNQIHISKAWLYCCINFVFSVVLVN